MREPLERGAVTPRIDANIAREHRRDVEPAAGLAHRVSGQARVEREAGTAIQNVQHGRFAGKIQRRFDMTIRMSNNIAEQFAENDLRVTGFRGRSPEALQRCPICWRIAIPSPRRPPETSSANATARDPQLRRERLKWQRRLSRLRRTVQAPSCLKFPNGGRGPRVLAHESVGLNRHTLSVERL